MSKDNMDNRVTVKVLPERLRQARTRMLPEMLQREVGQMIGKSTPCIGMWETGRSEPRLHDLLSLAKIYKVSVEWLLGVETDTTALSNTVPLLSTEHLIAWDFTATNRHVQAGKHYIEGEAAAWSVSTDALKSLCQTGDTAIIERDTLPALGAVYLVVPKDGGAATLRRCDQDGVFIFTPDQAGFGMYREHQIDIVGRVREIIRRTTM